MENCLKPFTRNAIKLENNLDGKLERFLIKSMSIYTDNAVHVMSITFVCLNEY